MIIPADSILIQAGHTADLTGGNNKDRKEKRLVVTEEEVTGEHDYKFKTAITQGSASELTKFCEKTGMKE
jgi:hypothetical protein